MESSIIAFVQETALATLIREDWFPVIESLHVIALATVIGTIFIVDLRLTGAAAKHLRFSHISAALLPWTWAAFGVAAVTGALMFIANVQRYAEMWTFLLKMGLLLLAGVNMVVFHFGTGRRVTEWDDGVPPAAARLSGMLSILLWSGVLAAGRWIGFL